jgi:hypothetical protein
VQGRSGQSNIIKTTALRSPIWIIPTLALYIWVLWATLGWTISSRNAGPQWGLLPSGWIFHNPVIAQPAKPGWRILIPKPGLYDGDILLWGAERFEAGQSPLAPELLGDSNIRYNYPSGWRILTLFRLRRSDRIALGWAFALIFSATLFWVLPPSSCRAFLLHAAILTSAPCLNALGEANGELLVVALIALSALFAMKNGLCAEIASLLSLGLAATLKLYPAAGFGVLGFRRGQFRWKPIFAGAIVIFWFLITASEIATVVKRTPKPVINAFGWELLPLRARSFLNSHSEWCAGSPQLAKIVAGIANAKTAIRIAYLSVVVIGLECGRRARRVAPKPDTGAADILMAMGAGLFVAAFGIGSSWSYRLLVLILCIGAAARRGGQGWLLLLLVAGLWSTLLTNGPEFIVEQLLLWTLVFVLSREVGENAFG